MAFLSLLPLGYVIWRTSELGWSEAVDFLWRPRIGDLLWNTFRLLVVTTSLATVLGVAAAVLVERTDLRGRGLWHGLMCAPLAVPAFVNGYAWVSATQSVQNFAGAVLVTTLSYFPLVYLPTLAALRGLDMGMSEAATVLGRSPWAVFWRVTLPVVKPAVLGGGLLVGLHMLAEYGALQLLNYPTLTTSILEQYGTGFNAGKATLLAGVLVTLCLLLLLIEAVARGGRSRARVGSGSPRPPQRVRLGRGQAPAQVGLLLIALLAVGLPLLSLLRWLGGTSATLDLSLLTEVTMTTLGLAVGGGLLATAAALPVVWLAVRYRGLMVSIVERSTYTANALPGIVVALALVAISIRAVPSLYQSTAVLLVGYCILFLPRAVVSCRGALELIPHSLDEVARSLGCSGPSAAFRVTLPLLLPGLAASSALVSLAVSTELTATLLLSPLGTETLSTRFWANASSVEYGAAAPYALALILLSIPATWLLGRLAVKGRV